MPTVPSNACGTRIWLLLSLDLQALRSIWVCPPGSAALLASSPETRWCPACMLSGLAHKYNYGLLSLFLQEKEAQSPNSPALLSASRAGANPQKPGPRRRAGLLPRGTCDFALRAKSTKSSVQHRKSANDTVLDKSPKRTDYGPYCGQLIPFPIPMRCPTQADACAICSGQRDVTGATQAERQALAHRCTRACCVIWALLAACQA